MPYLFTRSVQLARANLLDSMAWSVKITEKVNAIAETPVLLWSSLMSPDLGRLTWSTAVEDLSPESRASVAGWARAWTAWVSATFLGHYFEVAGDSPMLPETEDETRRMLHAMLLDKAVYESGYELDHRPDWLPVPVRGVLDLLDEGP